jgi:cysteinyl-tRNA synthetase
MRWWPSALQAKKQRNFARADQIRNELAEKAS